MGNTPSQDDFDEFFAELLVRKVGYWELDFWSKLLLPGGSVESGKQESRKSQYQQNSSKVKPTKPQASSETPIESYENIDIKLIRLLKQRSIQNSIDSNSTNLESQSQSVSGQNVANGNGIGSDNLFYLLARTLSSLRYVCWVVDERDLSDHNQSSQQGTTGLNLALGNFPESHVIWQQARAAIRLLTRIFPILLEDGSLEYSSFWMRDLRYVGVSDPGPQVDEQETKAQGTTSTVANGNGTTTGTVHSDDPQPVKATALGKSDEGQQFKSKPISRRNLDSYPFLEAEEYERMASSGTALSTVTSVSQNNTQSNSQNQISLVSEILYFLNRLLFLPGFTSIGAVGSQPKLRRRNRKISNTKSTSNNQEVRIDMTVTSSSQGQPSLSKLSLVHPRGKTIDPRFLWRSGIGVAKEYPTIHGQTLPNSIIQNRTEVLNCLLVVLSGPLFCTSEELVGISDMVLETKIENMNLESNNDSIISDGGPGPERGSVASIEGPPQGSGSQTLQQSQVDNKVSSISQQSRNYHNPSSLTSITQPAFTLQQNPHLLLSSRFASGSTPYSANLFSSLLSTVMWYGIEKISPHISNSITSQYYSYSTGIVKSSINFFSHFLSDDTEEKYIESCIHILIVMLDWSLKGYKFNSGGINGIGENGEYVDDQYGENEGEGDDSVSVIASELGYSNSEVTLSASFRNFQSTVASPDSTNIYGENFFKYLLKHTFIGKKSDFELDLLVSGFHALMSGIYEKRRSKSVAHAEALNNVNVSASESQQSNYNYNQQSNSTNGNQKQQQQPQPNVVSISDNSNLSVLVSAVLESSGLPFERQIIILLWQIASQNPRFVQRLVMDSNRSNEILLCILEMMVLQMQAVKKIDEKIKNNANSTGVTLKYKEQSVQEFMQDESESQNPNPNPNLKQSEKITIIDNETATLTAALKGSLHLLGFLLLVLSSERDFAVNLNQEINDPSSPNLGKSFSHTTFQVPRFASNGTYADLLILVVNKVISLVLSLSDFSGVIGTQSQQQDGAQKQNQNQNQNTTQVNIDTKIIDHSDIKDSLVDVLLTVLCNVSAYLKSGLCGEACLRLFSLVDRLSRPNYLFKEANNHRNLFSILEFMNTLLQYQTQNNQRLVYSILRNKDIFIRRLEKIDIRSYYAGNSKGGGNDSSAISPVSDASGSVIGSKQQSNLMNNSQDMNNFDPSLLIWFDSWKSQLQSTHLNLILRVIDKLGPAVDYVISVTEECQTEDDILRFLSKDQNTLVGILPQPHPILVRTYQASAETNLWFTNYLWNVVAVSADSLGGNIEGVRVRMM